MNNKGVTLIELMVTITVTVLSVLFGIILYQSQYKEKVRIQAITKATSDIRRFFDLRGKLVRSGTATTFTAFSPIQYLNVKDFSKCNNATVEGCQSLQKTLKIDANSGNCQGTVSEVIEVDCVARSTKLSDPINLKVVAGPTDVFSQCVPADCAAQNGILSLAKIPRIKVTRSSFARNLGGVCVPQTAITYFPEGQTNNISSDGTSGNPVAAVVCMQIPLGTKPDAVGVHCGTLGAPRSPTSAGAPAVCDDCCIDCELPITRYSSTSPATKTAQNLWTENCPLYRDFNLSVFMLVRYGTDKFDLVKQVANFPKPNLITGNSAKILGTTGK